MSNLHLKNVVFYIKVIIFSRKHFTCKCSKNRIKAVKRKKNALESVSRAFSNQCERGDSNPYVKPLFLLVFQHIFKSVSKFVSKVNF